MDVQLELEGVAVYTRLITVVIKSGVPNNPLAHIALRASWLVASSNCDEVWQPCFDDGIDAGSDLILTAGLELVGEDSGVHIMVVNLCDASNIGWLHWAKVHIGLGFDTSVRRWRDHWHRVANRKLLFCSSFFFFSPLMPKVALSSYICRSEEVCAREVVVWVTGIDPCIVHREGINEKVGAFFIPLPERRMDTDLAERRWLSCWH